MIPNLASRDPWGHRETTWKTWSRRIKTSIGSFRGKTPIGFLGFQFLGSFLLNSKWAKRRNPWNSWEQCDQPELWAVKQNVPQAQGGLCFPHNTFQAPGTEGHWNTGCSLENISTCVCFTTDNVTHPCKLTPVCTSMASEENYPNRKSFYHTQKSCSSLQGENAAGNQWGHVRRFVLIQWQRTPQHHLQGRQVYIFLVIMGRLCLTEQIMACVYQM